MKNHIKKHTHTHKIMPKIHQKKLHRMKQTLCVNKIKSSKSAEKKHRRPCNTDNIVDFRVHAMTMTTTTQYSSSKFICPFLGYSFDPASSQTTTKTNYSMHLVYLKNVQIHRAIHPMTKIRKSNHNLFLDHSQSHISQR